MNSSAVLLVFVLALSSQPSRLLAMDFREEVTKIFKDYLVGNRHVINSSLKHQQVADFIEEFFRELGLSVITQRFESSVGLGQNSVKAEGLNIIAIHNQTSVWNTPQDAPLVIGAHYDTDADGDGVDNNGSGVLAMLLAAKEIAKFKDLTRSVIFAAFDLQLKEHEHPTASKVGSGEFVNAFLGPLLLKNNARLDGAIILDGIMNYDNIMNSQSLPEGFPETFPETYEALVANTMKGNFLLAIHSHQQQDVDFVRKVKKYWDKSMHSSEKYRLYETFIEPVGTSTEAKEEFMKQDHLNFWSYYPNGELMHLPAILLTDTGYWRATRDGCGARRSSGRIINDGEGGSGSNYGCQLSSFLNEDRVNFLQKSVETIIDLAVEGADRGASAAVHGNSLLLLLGILLAALFPSCS